MVQWPNNFLKGTALSSYTEKNKHYTKYKMYPFEWVNVKIKTRDQKPKILCIAKKMESKQ